MFLEHAAFGGRRPLLVLTRIAVAPQRHFQAIQRSLIDLLGPEQLTCARPGVRPSDGSLAPAVEHKLLGQTKVLVSAFDQCVACEVRLMQALLDHDFVTLGEIV
jgi:hypothetical protein